MTPRGVAVGMRFLAALVLLLTVALTGCATAPDQGPAPTSAVPTATTNAQPSDSGAGPWLLAASGTLRESGPPYNLTYACGVSLTSAELRADKAELWMVRPASAPDPDEVTLAAFSGVAVQRMANDGCDGGPQAKVFAAPDTRWSYVPLMPGTLRIEAKGDGITVNGTHLAPGASVGLDVSWTLQGRHGGPAQNYTYTGTVTVTNLGRGTVHYTDHGWGPGCRPEGCPR